MLSELLWVERRLAFDVLPEVIEAVSDPELQRLFEQHLAETREHVARVEDAFRSLDMEPSSAFSPGFNGLIEQHDTVAGKIVEPELADRWHASAGVAAEHFELALYAALDPLVSDDLLALLRENRSDEEAALKQLLRWLQ